MYLSARVRQPSKLNWPLVVLLTSLFLTTQLHISSLQILVLIAAIPIVIGRPITGLALYLVTATSGTFFSLPIVQGISLSRGFALLYLAGALLAAAKRQTKIHGTLLGFVFVLSLINFGSLFYSLAPDGTLETALTMTLNFLIVLITVIVPWGDEKQAIGDLGFASVATLLYFALVLVSGGLSDVTRVSLNDAVNTNDFAKAITQLLSFALWGGLIGKGQAIGSRLWWILGLFVGVPMLYATGSRSSIFGLGAGMLAFIFLVLGRQATISRVGALTAILTTGVGALFGYAFFPQLLERLTLDSIIASQGTRRFIIWEYLLRDIVPRHLWFGTGLGGQTVLVALAGVPFIYQKPAHNLVLDLLVQVGVIGLVAYVSFLLWCLWRGVCAVRGYVFSAPFFIMLVASLGIGAGETMFDDKLMWLAVAVLLRHGLATPSHGVPSASSNVERR